MMRVSRMGARTAAWTIAAVAGLGGCADETTPRSGENVCPVLDTASALPTTAAVGETIALTGVAHDPDEGPGALTYAWTATSGTLSSPTAASPGFTCTEVGTVSLTLTVSDGDTTEGCAATQTVTVTCTEGETEPPEVATVDLSRYVRIGRYDLPEPSRTTPPSATSLLAQEASAVTYNWDTDTLFVVGDGGTTVVQIDKTGHLIDSMMLAAGSSPQGTEFYDTEGLTYVGDGRFVITEERYRQANLFTYAAGTTLTRAMVRTVKLGTTIGNVGIEGLSFDPANGHFVFAKEKTPGHVFDSAIDFVAGVATNGSPTTTESTPLFDPALASLLDFSDVFALSNLPSLEGDDSFDELLILSQESGQIVQVDRSGQVQHRMTLRTDATDTLTIADMTVEGLTMDRDGFLYLVNEAGGGDASHPQLWVYGPSTATNVAPTAVSLADAVVTMPQSTSTAAAIPVARIEVTDEGLGDNGLSIAGPDASSFELVGRTLLLKAGVTLDASAKPTYQVTIAVDDVTVGATPDATITYTLTITSTGTGEVTLAITEVAPWSSSSAIGADWFEVTNFGTSAVDLTGWTMDDSSGASALSVPLSGVTSLAPGESAIFLETATLATVAPTFLTTWFGGTVPAGLQIGSYSGSGVGLSTGGDGVHLFDGTGTLQANVTFGPAPSAAPLATFDNAAGLNDMAVTTLSIVGQNGAFVAANDVGAIGSPGTVGAGATPIVGIVAVDDTASEAGADTAVFRFTRSGSTTSAMTVNYVITTGAGQATADDYTPTLSGTVSIPAGQASLDVTIVPVDDVTPEGTETLTLTLFDTGSYDVGAADSATVSLLDDDAANQAPTAVSLINTVSSISEAADVTSAVRVADVSVTDDGMGTNVLSLSGTDAAAFQITGGSLFLVAGTALDHASKPTLAVTVAVDDASVGGTPDATVGFTLTVTQAATPPSALVISEIAAWSSSSSLGADWFEVTNTGAVAVDLTGWKVDDSSHAIATAVALNGISSIAPGEAVIFIETTDLATASAAFTTLWFGANPARAPRIGSYAGSGIGLSGSGDEVTLFDAAGNLVAGVGFGASPAAPLATFDNHAGTTANTLPLTVIAGLSAVGVNGAFAAAGDANQVGSPGIGNVGRLLVTEVAPWGSNASYAADWFEVTNVGSEPVDLTGWTVDDSSNAVATSVALVGVASVAPGQSVVFYEGAPGAIATAFQTAWFGSSVPSGLAIGSYTGSGIGLSGSGDAVNLFDASGLWRTGVTFGAATTNVSFDNAAGLASVTTLSVVGVRGAFVSADGLATGSPGVGY